MILRQWGFNYIITKISIKRASADVGFMLTAYNLRRIMNIIGKKQMISWLSELISSLIRILRQISSHKLNPAYSFIQTKNQVFNFEMSSK